MVSVKVLASKRFHRSKLVSVASTIFGKVKLVKLASLRWSKRWQVLFRLVNWAYVIGQSLGLQNQVSGYSKFRQVLMSAFVILVIAKKQFLCKS